MAGFAVGDIISISWDAQAFNQTILNTLTYRVTASSGGTSTVQSDSFDIATVVNTGGAADLTTKITNIVSEEWTLGGITVQDVFPIRYRSFTLDSAALGARGACNRPNCSGVITRRTILSGRDQVSSIKFGPTADDDVADGSMNGGWRDLAQVLADAMEVVIAGPTTLRLEPVIWHRGVPFDGLYYSRVTDCVPQVTSRVMRRRTVGVGK